MKTKTLILVGIAVCAILFTSPALASAGYSKIYGNANEDDVLDMRDVTYIKLVIFGKKPATTFADANYDGKISMLDIGQTKLIILGKEKQLTLVDHADRTVTVPRPIERIVSPSLDGTRTIVQLGAVDKLVGVYGAFAKYEHTYGFVILRAYPKLVELPNVGYEGQEDLELIVSLKPDVIFGSSSYADSMQEKTGIPVICLSISGSLDFEAHRLTGKVIEKGKEAEELISYANEKLEKITEVTSQIPDGEKPKVYLAFWSAITRTPIRYDPLDLAGGINVAKGCTPTTYYSIEVSKEQIIAWNPDIILLHSVWGLDERGKQWGNKIEEVLSDPDLQTINAVKNCNINYTKGFMMGWDPAAGLTETFYMAKLCHPDKFRDLDMEKEGNEILERFYGVDGLYSEMAEGCELYRWE